MSDSLETTSRPHSKGPFEHLGLEHAGLEKALAVFERWLSGSAEAQAASRADFETIIDYLAVFADLGHQDKEESLLTPALVEHGFDWYDGPVARMRREHRQERYLLRALSELARQRAPWSNEDVRRIRSVGRELLDFMRAHVEFENREVFGPALARLPLAVRDRLLLEFERFDAEHAASTDEAAVEARLRALAESYGIA